MTFNECSDKVKRSIFFAMADTRRDVFLPKFHEIYKIAKENIWCNSQVFDLKRWNRLARKRENTINTRLAISLLTSSIHLPEFGIQSLFRNVFDNGLINQDLTRLIFADCFYGANIDINISSDVKGIAKEIFETGNLNMFGYLADACEDFGSNCIVTHLRSGYHSLACPVLQEILK